MNGPSSQNLIVDVDSGKRVEPHIGEIPTFHAASDAYQRFGLLALAEMAARQGGNTVFLRSAGRRGMLLLSGVAAADHFARSVDYVANVRGDVTSNAAAMHRLLGDSDLAKAWRQGNLNIDERLPPWLEHARANATRTLLHAALQPEGAHQLSELCRFWSVRACCPALFGHGLADRVLIEGLVQIETYFTAVNGIGPKVEGREARQAFKHARAFVDDTVAAALAQDASEANNAMCALRALLPATNSEKRMVDTLRPVIFGLLFEAIHIDGLNLLWTLVELARSNSFAEAIALEAQTDATSVGPLARAAALEAMRLYPELPFIVGTGAILDFNGEESRTGTILYAPWLVHRDARLWPEPTQFLPQRFLPSADGPLSEIYMPFGLGRLARKRTHFVIDQIAATISTICSETCLSLAPSCRPGDLRPVYRTTLQPRGSVDVHWQRRPNAVATADILPETEKSNG